MPGRWRKSQFWEMRLESGRETLHFGRLDFAVVVGSLLSSAELLAIEAAAIGIGAVALQASGNNKDKK